METCHGRHAHAQDCREHADEQGIHHDPEAVATDHESDCDDVKADDAESCGEESCADSLACCATHHEHGHAPHACDHSGCMYVGSPVGVLKLELTEGLLTWAPVQYSAIDQVFARSSSHLTDSFRVPPNEILCKQVIYCVWLI